MSLDAIKERLRKILHLANNAGSEGEANAAFAQAKRLMLKHNLTEADLGESQGDVDHLEVFRFKRIPTYVLYICTMTAEHFHVTASSDPYRCYFYGTKLNREAAAQFAISLNNRINEVWAESRRCGLSKKSFAIGVILRVDEQMVKVKASEVEAELKAEGLPVMRLSKPVPPDLSKRTRKLSSATCGQSLVTGYENGDRCMPALAGLEV